MHHSSLNLYFSQILLSCILYSGNSIRVGGRERKGWSYSFIQFKKSAASMWRPTSIFCKFLRSLCSVSVSIDPDGRHWGWSITACRVPGLWAGEIPACQSVCEERMTAENEKHLLGPQSSSGVEILPQLDPSPHVSPSPPLTQLTNQAWG